MIKFEEVSKIYPDDSVAIRDINMAIDHQEFVSIAGHSGAGKTTLLKMILAEEFPSRGRVLVDEVEVQDLRKHEVNELRRRVGIVFQDFRLLAHKTVFENVSFAMEVAGRDDEEIEADVPYALNLVGLGRKAHNFPRQLSGGEQQRAAIARAIVNQPDIVIADEPTGNLDPMNTYDIVEILNRIHELGTTVILATHNTGIIDNLDKRVVTIEEGRLVHDTGNRSKK